MRLGHVERAVLAHLRDSGGEADIPCLGADSTSTNLACFRLVEKGLAVSLGRAATTVHGRYRLTPSGSDTE